MKISQKKKYLMQNTRKNYSALHLNKIRLIAEKMTKDLQEEASQSEEKTANNDGITEWL